jgi:hypothetical protein
MPPRHTYWTIILEGKPTAFRAHTQDELMPTLRQLQARHPEAVMMWFARGRLWESPVQAQAAFERRAASPRRDAGWRPGGTHRDPRDRFRIPRDEKRRRFAAKLHRDDRKAQGRPPERPRDGGDRLQGERPRGGQPEGQRPWNKGPRPDRRPGWKPGRPPGDGPNRGDRSGQPGRERPDRPGGPANRRPPHGRGPDSGDTRRERPGGPPGARKDQRGWRGGRPGGSAPRGGPGRKPGGGRRGGGGGGSGR